MAPPSGDRRPFLLFLAHPLTGHLTPAVRVASALHSRGWPVFVLGPTAHQARIAASGATFFPLQGDADLDDLAYYSPDNPRPPVPDYYARDWRQRNLVDVEAQCLRPIPAQWASVKAALKVLHARDPSRQVVVVCEAVFHGLMPLFYGATLPEGVPRPRSICLSVTVPLIRSVDLPPFGPYKRLAFDPSPEGRARNAAAWERWDERRAPLRRMLDEKLLEAGAARGVDGSFLAGANYLCHDIVLQLGVPGFFYPRSDWPAKFRFAGIILAAQPPPGGWGNLPAWWDDVLSAADPLDGSRRKKVVVVAQGTVEFDPHDLIIPTIRALAGRTDDVLVVAILGRRGATLPPNEALPANVRVADYLSYEAVLPHADVWVHNAGYGAVTHGIAHGVPMVVAGEGQDKPENARRVAYSRIGIDLDTGRPGAEAVRKAVEEVLADGKFRERVEELRAEAEALDCFDCVERAVTELTE
ncbi:Glycosyltransferase [Pleurostoma richardsiae]|uniref:Glycosyltransferase n=1 Tax=Pleurostoma richardsiae TaxID=41990 RepID=A0AA38RJC3_9PEZI|nr:Glycosyltransferase [Pleurostoma richardsiae]